MSDTIRSRFTQLFGRSRAKRATRRLMAWERLERRELFAVTWVGGNGAWSNRNNWSPSSLPTINDDVEIGSASVTIDSTSAFAKSIKTGGALTVSGGGSLTVNGNITQAGASSSLSILTSGVLTTDQLTTASSINVRRGTLIANKVTAAGNVSAGLAQGSSAPLSELRISGPLKTGGSLTLSWASQVTNAVIDSGTTVYVTADGLANDFSLAAVFKNATVDGKLDLQAPDAKALINQKLTQNGEMILGQRAKLGFAGPTSLLTGIGTVRFQDLSTNSFVTVNAGATATIDSGITLQAGNTKAIPSQMGAASGASNTTFILKGKLFVNDGTTFRLGNLDGGQTARVIIDGGSIEVGNNATLLIEGELAASGADKITTKTALGSVELLGILDNTANVPLNFGTTWTLKGGTVRGGTLRQNTSGAMRFTSVGGVLRDVTVEGDARLDNGAKVDVLGTLTYNGTLTMAGGNLRFTGAVASLLGTGTVVFVDNAASSSALLAYTDGMKLIIGPNILVTGGSNNSTTAAIGSLNPTASLGSEGDNTSVEIQGRVLANLAGRVITLSPKNKLVNKGAIEAKAGGNILLYGNFTTDDLGSVTNTGGVIGIKGTLDNINHTLDLSGTSDPWTLSGGKISGGTIVQTPRSLRFSVGGGELIGVTMQGDVDLSSEGLNFTVRNGLQLNGTATIAKNSFIKFIGTQTFDGQATVDLAASLSKLIVSGTNAKLTIGENVLVKVETNTGPGSSTPSGIVGEGANQNSTVTLNGTVLSKYPNSVLQFDLDTGLLVLNGKIESQAGEVRINPNMQKFTVPSGGSLVSANGATISIGPSFEIQSQTADKVKLFGTTKLIGSASAPQLLDAASRDVGLSSEGFVESNFLMGTLHVANSTNLRLLDNLSNDGDPAKPDAVYVNSLVIDANATFNLAGIHVYARSFKGNAVDPTDPNNKVKVIPAGGNLPFNLTIPAKTASTTDSHTWTFQGRDGARINLDVQPTTATFWVRLRLVDALGTTVATEVSTSAGGLAKLRDFELKSTGLYSVIIEAAPGHPSAGDYTITAVDVTPDRRRVNVVVSSNQSSGITYGSAVVIEARVTPRSLSVPDATGRIQFQLDGANIDAPIDLVGGVASLTLSRPSTGLRNITAIYLSDNAAFDNQQGSFVQLVQKRTLTVAARALPARIAGSDLELLYDITGFVSGEGTEQVRGVPKLFVDPAAAKIAGTYTILVSAGDNLSASNYFFSFTNAVMVVLPSTPARINLVAGNEQSVKINRVLPLAFKLKVLDEFSNVIPDASVVFTAPSGSGAFAGGTTTVTTVTSSSGETQAPLFTASDQLGTYIVTATCGQAPAATFLVTIRDAGPPLELLPVAGLREGDGNVTITLQRRDVVAPLTVSLAVDHPEFFSLFSQSITFAINEESKTFSAAIINDLVASTLLGGDPKRIVLTASSTSGLSSILTLTIDDDDIPALTLDAPTEMREAEIKTIKVLRNTATSNDLVVNLRSSDSQTLIVPESITIPAGQPFVLVPVQAFTDQVAFGPHTASITVTAPGLNSTSSSVNILDIDVRTLTLELIGRSDVEEGSAGQFRLTRNTPINVPLVVQLTSSSSLIDIPTTVTIPAGVSSAEFMARAVNDQIVSAARTLTIKANANGFDEVARNVTIVEDDVPTLTMSVDLAELLEGGDGAFVTVTRNTAQLPALNLTLVQQPSGRLLASTISFGAGDTAAFFTLLAKENSTFEGLQTVQLSVHADGFVDATSSLQIVDNEVLKIVPKNERTLSERGGTLFYTLSRQVDNPDVPLVVNLSSTDTSELSVESTVIIPAGSTSVDFSVGGVDDNLLDDAHDVQIVASATGYKSATESATVTDWEAVAIHIENPSIAENGGQVTAVISRSNIDDLAQDLVVTLESSDPARFQFPASTVTIPAGQASMEVIGVAIDNGLTGPESHVTLRVTAPNFNSDEMVVTILQDDFHIWSNPRDNLDVNDSGEVTAIDALLIINWLNTVPSTEPLPAVFLRESGYIDTNGDDFATPLDALLVINALNSKPAGEGEATLDHIFESYDQDDFSVQSRTKRGSARF